MWSQPLPQSLSLVGKDLGSLSCELAGSCGPNSCLPYSDPIVNPRTHPKDAAPLMKMATLPLPSETRDPHLSPEQRIRRQEFTQQPLELAPSLHPLLLGEDKDLEGKD